MKLIFTISLLLISSTLFAKLPVEDSNVYYCTLAKYVISVERFTSLQAAQDFCKSKCGNVIDSSDLKRDFVEIEKDHPELLDRLILQDEGELIVWSWVEGKNNSGIMIYAPYTQMLNVIKNETLSTRAKRFFDIPALCKIHD